MIMSLQTACTRCDHVIPVGKAVAGHKEGGKMHQQIAKENLQVMEWINCMKSVCRIESKWYVIHNVTVAIAIATVAIAIATVTVAIAV